MLQHDIDLLKKAYNQEIQVNYIGGSLLLTDTNGQVFEYILREKDQYDEADILIAKLYLRHKTEQHSYYELAEKIV